jgi:N-carbamoylputrescine amidase
MGRMLAVAPDDEEAVLVVECDRSAVERVRRDWPFLRDRRIDAYQGLGDRFSDRGDAFDRSARPDARGRGRV